MDPAADLPDFHNLYDLSRQIRLHDVLDATTLGRELRLTDVADVLGIQGTQSERLRTLRSAVRRGRDQHGYGRDLRRLLTLEQVRDVLLEDHLAIMVYGPSVSRADREALRSLVLVALPEGPPRAAMVEDLEAVVNDVRGHDDVGGRDPGRPGAAVHPGQVAVLADLAGGLGGDRTVARLRELVLDSPVVAAALRCDVLTIAPDAVVVRQLVARLQTLAGGGLPELVRRVVGEGRGEQALFDAGLFAVVLIGPEFSVSDLVDVRRTLDLPVADGLPAVDSVFGMEELVRDLRLDEPSGDGRQVSAVPRTLLRLLVRMVGETGRDDVSVEHLRRQLVGIDPPSGDAAREFAELRRDMLLRRVTESGVGPREAAQRLRVRGAAAPSQAGAGPSGQALSADGVAAAVWGVVELTYAAYPHDRDVGWPELEVMGRLLSSPVFQAAGFEGTWDGLQALVRELRGRLRPQPIQVWAAAADVRQLLAAFVQAAAERGGDEDVRMEDLRRHWVSPLAPGTLALLPDESTIVLRRPAGGVRIPGEVTTFDIFTPDGRARGRYEALIEEDRDTVAVSALRNVSDVPGLLDLDQFVHWYATEQSDRRFVEQPPGSSGGGYRPDAAEVNQMARRGLESRGWTLAAGRPSGQPVTLVHSWTSNDPDWAPVDPDGQRLEVVFETLHDGGRRRVAGRPADASTPAEATEFEVVEPRSGDTIATLHARTGPDGAGWFDDVLDPSDVTHFYDLARELGWSSASASARNSRQRWARQWAHRRARRRGDRLPVDKAREFVQHVVDTGVRVRGDLAHPGYGLYRAQVNERTVLVRALVVDATVVKARPPTPLDKLLRAEEEELLALLKADGWTVESSPRVGVDPYRRDVLRLDPFNADASLAALREVSGQGAPRRTALQVYRVMYKPPFSPTRSVRRSPDGHGRRVPGPAKMPVRDRIHARLRTQVATARSRYAELAPWVWAALAQSGLVGTDAWLAWEGVGNGLRLVAAWLAPPAADDLDAATPPLVRAVWEEFKSMRLMYDQAVAMLPDNLTIATVTRLPTSEELIRPTPSGSKRSAGYASAVVSTTRAGTSPDPTATVAMAVREFVTLGHITPQTSEHLRTNRPEMAAPAQTVWTSALLHLAGNVHAESTWSESTWSRLLALLDLEPNPDVPTSPAPEQAHSIETRPTRDRRPDRRAVPGTTTAKSDGGHAGRPRTGTGTLATPQSGRDHHRSASPGIARRLGQLPIHCLAATG